MARDVRLPNGTVIKNVPDNVTKEQVRQKAIETGKARPEDFGQPQPTPSEQPQVSQQEQAMEDERRQRAIMPGGAAGRPEGMPVNRPMTRGEAVGGGGFVSALAGGAAGAPLGPKGILAGTILGGMAGSYGGSLVGDKLEGKELDYAKATEESLFSLGIDVGTIGAGKIAKPVIRNHFVPMMQRLGFTPKETAEEVAAYSQFQNRRGEEGLPVGSPESIRETQGILSQGDATLTPFQTGEANRIQNFSEKIARLGLVSQYTMDRNLARQTEVIRNELDTLTTSLYPSGRFRSDELAETLYNTISQGKSALQTSYVRGLDDIAQSVSGKRVPTIPVARTLREFRERGEREFGNIYDNQTLSLVDEFTEKVNRPGADISARDLIDFEKNLQTRINQLGDTNSPLYNSAASSDLADLSKNLRETIVSSLDRLDPKVANNFVNLKDEYNRGINTLLPKINKRFIDAAGKNDFKTMGNLLVSANNPSSIKAFFNSIDESFAQAKKAGSQLNFGSAREAKDAVRSTFIREQFPDIDEVGGFTIEQYSNLARRLEKPSEAAKYSAVLGENYKPFKQLVNAMSEASKKPEGNLGALMVRTQEYNAGRQLLNLGQASAAGGALVGSGPLAAGGILFLPVFLAKNATNKNKVNRILAFDKRSFDSDDAMATAAYNLAIDLFDDLPEEDQKEIRRSVRGADGPQAEGPRQERDPAQIDVPLEGYGGGQ